MRVFAGKTGFSILEVLVAVGIMAVLATLVLGLGKQIQTQAAVQLCRSEMKVLQLGMQLYYQVYSDFPFTTVPDDPVWSDYSAGVFDEKDLIWHLKAAYPDAGVAEPFISGQTEDTFATSETLYFYLNRCPESKQILSTIDKSLIDSGDRNGDSRIYGAGIVDLDLFRFIDPWGNPIRYSFLAGDAFPVVESPGADNEWGTADDINAD